MKTKYLKFGFVIFFLSLYFHSIAQLSNGSININGSSFDNTTLNTGTINYNPTRKVYQLDKESINNIKKVPEIAKIVATLSLKVDDANNQLSKLMTMLDSKDSTIIAQNALIEKLIFDRQLYIKLADSAFSLLNNRQKKIEARKYNYLPFGIHQILTTKQTGKGIFFTATEAGLLVASYCYGKSASRNFNKHKNNKYEQWERDRFFKKYKNQSHKSEWFLAGAAVMIGLNYCDNFNLFRKKNIETAFVPTFDWQGKPLMAMTFNVKF